MHLTPKRFPNLGQRGFTFVELTVASAIIISSIGALGWSFKAMQQARVRGELISGVTSLEIGLTTALLDEASYNDPAGAIRTDLQAGVVSPLLNFNVRGDSGATFTIKPGDTKTLTKNGQDCVGFPSKSCPFRIRLEMKRLSGGGTLTSDSMAYAYRIESRDPSIQLNFRGAGSDGDITDAFADSEYSITVPYEYYLTRSPAGRLTLECPPETTIGVWGIDRSGGGRVSCIEQPRDTCPQGTLPKGLKFVPRAGGEASLEFECGPAIQTASCNNDYSLQSIDTTSLDIGRTKSGQCVYAGASSATAPAPNPFRGERIEGRVCPRGYRSASSCNIVNVVSAPGSCPWCSASGLNCGASSTWESPIGTQNMTIPYQCTDSTPLTMPANAGRVVFSQNSPGPGEVLCYLQRAQQDCGATWTAQVELNVTCVIDTPSTPETTPVY